MISLSANEVGGEVVFTEPPHSGLLWRGASRSLIGFRVCLRNLRAKAGALRSFAFHFVTRRPSLAAGLPRETAVASRRSQRLTWLKMRNSLCTRNWALRPRRSSVCGLRNMSSSTRPISSGSSALLASRPSTPSRICWRRPQACVPSTGTTLNMASVAVKPNPSRSEFCTTSREQRCSAFTINALCLRDSIGSVNSTMSRWHSGGRLRY